MDFVSQIQRKIDSKTKPIGALGMLEDIAKQLCQVQNTLEPELVKPSIIVFAGDHGIAGEGVSAYPQDVTWQMVMNFVQGGAAINVFTQQNNMALYVVDAGVNYDFPDGISVIGSKIAKGTQSFLRGEAMNADQVQRALSEGAKHANKCIDQGTNVLGFGEMGIANTASATALICQLTGISVAQMTGRGTGLDDAQLLHKVSVIEDALSFHGAQSDPLQVLQTFGGFEIAQMVGAMLEAQSRNCVVLVDGFIATAAYLLASMIQPELKTNAVFCHQSHEQGHQKVLAHLGAKPLLNLDLRLGEGTGCALAYPLLLAAANFMNDMASFEQAGVSESGE